jgi:hypothetical protein
MWAEHGAEIIHECSVHNSEREEWIMQGLKYIRIDRNEYIDKIIYIMRTIKGFSYSDINRLDYKDFKHIYNRCVEINKPEKTK